VWAIEGCNGIGSMTRVLRLFVALTAVVVMGVVERPVFAGGAHPPLTEIRTRFYG
jgi:hypothetical protein